MKVSFHNDLSFDVADLCASARLPSSDSKCAYGDITAGQMTYDLGRLRQHGLIHASQNGPLPGHGHRAAARPILALAHDHLLRDGFAELIDPGPPCSSQLRAAARAYQHAFDQHARRVGLAT